MVPVFPSVEFVVISAKAARFHGQLLESISNPAQTHYTFRVTIQEEQQLVQEAQEHLESFEKLYDLYLPKVYGFVMGKVRSQAIAEDLVSEAFLKILEGLPKYKFRGLPFGAWVFQIVRNHLNDYYAKAKRTQFDSLEDTSWLKDEDEEKDPATIARRNSTRQSLIDLFHVLTPQEAEVVRLKYFADLSNQEIADSLSLKANHVGVLLYRSLQKLKAEYV